MERVKKINQHFNGIFNILDYQITHSQLLLRCEIPVDNDKLDLGFSSVNIDLKFEMVCYIELPHTMRDIYITNGNDEDWSYIKKRYNNEIYRTPPHEFHQLYKIVSEGKAYYILAVQCWIDSNTLPPLDTSIVNPRP